MKLHLPYDVVYCTSSDTAHPVTSLGHSTVGPSIGWQSAPGGKIPQVLVLRFAGNVELTQLRILSHESKIASRVEVRLFALSGGDTLTDPPSFYTARFAKLGTVEFSSNEHSHYRSKERKTVHLTAKAYYVKLLFGSPHCNAHNPTGQIGVYSIECTGRLVSIAESHADVALHKSPARSSVSPAGSPNQIAPAPAGEEEEEEEYQEQLPRGENGKSAIRPSRSRSALRVTSPVQAPAQETIVSNAANASGGLSTGGGEIPAFRSVRIIQFENFFIRRSEELLALKDQAIDVDDFETAKKCRDRINLMSRHSRRIYQLEQDKVQAIIEEDFDAAKEAKRVMDTLVDRIYEDAQLPQPRPDFDPFDCIGDTSADMNEPRGEPLREHSEEHLSDMQVRAKPILIKQKTSRASSTEYISDREDAHELNSNGYGHHQDKNDNKNHNDNYSNNNNIEVSVCSTTTTTTTNNNKNENGRENGANVNGDGPPRSVSKRSHRASDVLRDMGERFDAMDPPALSEFNESPDDHIAAVDLSALPAWESRVAGAIQSACAGVDLTEPPASVHATARNTREAADLVSHTGMYTTSCLFSRRVPLREAALITLTGQMDLFEAARPVQLEEAVLRFLDMNGAGLQDSVPSVVAAACGFVRMVLADAHDCLPYLLSPAVNLLPRLLCCAADHQPRVRDEAMTTLALYVRTPAITNANVLTAVLAEPTDKERRRAPIATPRAQLARLAVLNQLAAEARSGLRGAENSVWSKLLLPCINHHSREVRDAAVNVMNHLVREKKFRLTERRKKEIDNTAIREQFASCPESPVGRGGKGEKAKNGARVKRLGKTKQIEA